MAVLHLQLILLAILVVCSKGSYMFSDTIMLDNGNYNVSYNFNESADIIQVLLEVNTTGWVGFGFALNAPNNMTDYDVAVGGVLSNGTGYLQDYLTANQSQPPLDTQQDWILISSKEQDDVTTLKFYRARNTTDEKDIAIERGEPIYLIWAYHSSNDVEQGQFDKHDISGSLQRTLIPALTSTVPISASTSTMVGTMSTSMAEMTTSSMAAMTTSTMEAMSTSTMAAMTTSTMAEMTTSTMAAMTTSTMEAMTTSTMAAMTTSTMAAMTTSTTPVIEPTTTTTASVASSSVVTPTPERPEHFANFVSENNGNYNASWMFNSSMDTLHFMVEVRATGWVGFGVANQAPTNMTDYDVAVGGVLNETGYLKDYLTIGRMVPRLDDQQDWTLTYSREENGVTTLRFYRKRDTNDQQNDTAIEKGISIFVIWAYHTSSDVQTGQFIQHSFRGFQQVTLIPAAPTTTRTPTTTPTSAMPQFTHCYDNNQFCLLWRFDDQNDKMYYHVRVKTTGWVGFGFAEVAPNNMLNYDVIVGGFRNGQGYINDYFTQGRMQPVPDSSQDYTLRNASEVGGYTDLWFERPRDTKDNKDVVFMPGRGVFLIWAYNDMDTTDERNFNRHSKMGVSPEKVVLVSEQPIPTEAAASSLQASFCGIVFLTILLWF